MCTFFSIFRLEDDPSNLWNCIGNRPEDGCEFFETENDNENPALEDADFSTAEAFTGGLPPGPGNTTTSVTTTMQIIMTSPAPTTTTTIPPMPAGFVPINPTPAAGKDNGVAPESDDNTIIILVAIFASAGVAVILILIAVIFGIRRKQDKISRKNSLSGGPGAAEWLRAKTQILKRNTSAGPRPEDPPSRPPSVSASVSPSVSASIEGSIDGSMSVVV